MPNSRQFEFMNMSALNLRCLALIESTNRAITHTQERVRRGDESVARQRESGLGCDSIVLRAAPVFPTLVDAEVYDDPSSVELINQAADSCSCCGSGNKSLVALVRFVSIDVEMVLCGDCYQSLSDRALGQVV
jgi:hypothetical protein